MEVKTSQGSGDTAVMAVSQNIPSPPAKNQGKGDK